VVVTLYTCIQKALGSNIGRTNLTDFLDFPLSPGEWPGKLTKAVTLRACIR
jgi:hypothetical protein